jgi:hypothetical protein
MKRGRLSFVLVFLCSAGLLLATVALDAADFVVVPSEWANIETGREFGEPIDGYDGQDNNSSQFLQYVIPQRYLTPLQGQGLTGLAFRLCNIYDNASPLISYSEYQIRLSIFSGVSLSTTFANNMVNPVTVLDGPFSFAEGAFPFGASGTTPNDFGSFLAFETPYDYSNGNLLVTIRHSAPQTTGNWLDWIPEAFSNSDFPSIFTHNMDATVQTGTWSGAPVTAFTTRVNPNNVVPEPATLTLLMVGGMAVLARRRKR